jgi:TIGR03009 family protein
MSGPRRIWVAALSALASMGFSLAAAQERADDRQGSRRQAQAAESPKIDMDQLLQMWEGQSLKLQSLEVAIYRVDTSKAWGDEEHYQGHAVFRSPQLAYLDFRKVKLQFQPDPKAKEKKIAVPVKKNNKIESTAYETIVCTGQEVWHYRYDVKQIIIYPLDKDQRKRALEEGPLPFLFNMKAADAKRRYEMVLQAQDAEVYLVMITPLLQDDKDSFSRAWVYLDKTFLLPKRIFLLAPDRNSSKDFRLSQIQANQPVKDRYFVGVVPPKPWKVERNPGGPAPAAPDARGMRRQANGKTAQRAPANDVDQPR